MSGATFNVSEFLDRQKLGGYHVLVVALCTVILCLDGYDTFVIGFTNVPMAKAFGVQVHDFTIAIVLQMAGLAVGAYVFSWLGDHYGRRVMLLCCAFMFGVLTLLAAQTGSLAAFTTVRFVSGFFFGGLYPLSISISGEIAPARYRTTVVMVLIAGYILGPALAAGATALLLPIYGWQGVYVAGGAVTLVLVPVLYFLLPESIRFRVHQDRRDPRIGQMLRRIDPALSLTGNEEYALAEEGEQQKPRVRDLFAQGRAAKTLLIWPSYFLIGATLPLLGTWMPAFLSVMGGLSAERAAALTGIFAASGIVAQPIVGYLIDRWSTPAQAAVLLFIFTAFIIASLGMIALDSGLLLYLALGLAGAGVTCSTSTLMALATYLYPTRIRTIGVGATFSWGRIGGIVGPGLGGVMLGAQLSLQSFFFVASAITVLGLLFVICLWMVSRGDKAAAPAVATA